VATRKTIPTAIRCVARVWSVLSIALVLVFVFGEVVGGGHGPKPTAQEWLGIALWPIGVGLGLVLAWRREILGGAIALSCLIAFCGWNLYLSGHLPRGPIFSLVAAPGALFVIAALLSQRTNDSGQSPLARRGPSSNAGAAQQGDEADER
jgi:peptidoglycan/LPS O-acetylase OafA/YrhL